MDKYQAIHAFWSQFGLTAYDENTVPDDAVMPYITYEVSIGSLDDFINMTGSLWYRSTSWREITQKADEIERTVNERGYYISDIDNRGHLYITKGVPFYQRMSDPADDMIRRIYFNLNAEFLSN